MRNIKTLLIIIVCGCIALPQIAFAGPGPVKISAMTRVESHSKVSDGRTSPDYSGETFGYMMISASRELQKNYIGSVFYLNRFSFDDDEMTTHIGGANIATIFSKRLVWTLGYSHTSNPMRGTINFPTNRKGDRLSTSFIYNFNPETPRRAKYSSITTYSTDTDLGEGQSISQKFKMKYRLAKRWESSLAYTYSYSVQNSDQLTNQIHGNITYKWWKATRLVLGVMYIDNVFEGSNLTGDDTVVRFTIMRSIR